MDLDVVLREIHHYGVLDVCAHVHTQYSMIYPDIHGLNIIDYGPRQVEIYEFMRSTLIRTPRYHGISPYFTGPNT